MYIFDTHAHYEDEAFDTDRQTLLQNMKVNGVGRVVNVGSSIETTRKTLELVKVYDFIYGAAGIHPEHIMQFEDADKYPNLYTELEAALQKEKIVALGEIGLDYHYEEPEKNFQKKHFMKQLELAKKIGKPVIIHSRDAAADTLEIMREQKAEEIGGIVHCFSYGKEMAAEYLKMGFYIGIGGVLTFKNAKKLKEVAEYVPMDRIVLETDCPYMAPEPHRGTRNNSENLKYVVDVLAEIKGLSKEEIMLKTWENGNQVYGIS